MSRAGVVTIDVRANVTQYLRDMEQARAQLRSLQVQSAASSGVKPFSNSGVSTFSREVAAANTRLAEVGKTGREVGGQISAGAKDASTAFSRLVKVSVEGALAIASAQKVLTAVALKYTAASSATDVLVNSYRALRLALSPTPFTVAAIATGVLIEKTIGLVNARGKLIEQQSLYAASNRVSISSVDRLDTISKLGGGDSATLRTLSGTLSNRIDSNQSSVRSGLNTIGVSPSLANQNEPLNPELLQKIAAGFASIEDPAKRAAAAVAIFGSDRAADALKQLDERFVNASQSVQKYGLVLDELSRNQVFQFRQDLNHIKVALTDFSEVRGWWEETKQGAEIIAAALEDASKRGARALDDLIAKYTGLRGAAVAPLSLTPSELRSDAARKESITTGITADDLFAQAQVARARRDAETLEGQRAAIESAIQKANTAYAALQADVEKRQINPRSLDLLTPEARFRLATEQQSKAGLAAALQDRVTAAESAQRISEQRNLAGAAAGGYGAKKRADIENQVSRQVGEGGGDGDRLRSRLSAEYDAQHAVQVAATVQGLRDQIDVEKALAAVQGHGAEAVHAATLEAKLRIIARDNDASSARSLTKAEKELFDAQRLNADAERNAALRENIAAINRVTAAESQGAEAVRLVELANKYDELRRDGRGATVAAEQEKDAAEKRKSDAQEIADLELKIRQTERLTAAVQAGSEAVRVAGLVTKYEDLERGGHAAAVPLQKRYDAAQKDHDDAVQAKKDADDQAESIRLLNERLDQEAAAQDRLRIAIGQGSDAKRLAQLATDQLERRQSEKGTGTSSIFIGVTNEELRRAGIDQTKNQNRILEQALGAGGSPQDRLRSINDELEALKAVKITDENILDVELARKALQQQRLQLMSQEALALGTARDGLRAFFIDMQQQAEKPGEILYAGLHTAVDRISDSLTDLTLGKKANFGQLLQDVGGQIAKESNKAILQTALGALGRRIYGRDPNADPANSSVGRAVNGTLSDKFDGFIFHLFSGKTFGPGIGPNAGVNISGKPDGTRTNPFYVVATIAGQPKQEQAQPVKQSFWGTVLGTFLGALTGAAIGAVGHAGPTESVSSSISFDGFRANGGLVSPRSAYLVGENGPEILTGASGRIASTLESRKLLSGGTGITYNVAIDARGTDPVLTEQRTRRGILAAHNAAVGTSVRATIELQKRTPPQR